MKLYLSYLSKIIKNNKLLLFLIFLITLLLIFCSVVTPILNAKFVDLVLVGRKINLFIPLLLTLLSLELINFIFSYIVEYFLNRVRFDFVKQEKDQYIDMVTNANTFKENIAESEYQTRFSELSEFANILTGQHFKLISSIILSIISLILILLISPKMIIILLILTPIFSFSNIVLLNKLSEYSNQVFMKNMHLQNKFIDYFGNIQLFYRNHLITKKSKQISNHTTEYTKSQIKFNNRMSFTTVFVIFSNNTLNLVLMACVGYLVLGNRLSLGEYYAVIQYINYFFYPIYVIPTVYTNITNTIITIDRYEKFSEQIACDSKLTNYLKVETIAFLKPKYDKRIKVDIEAYLEINNLYLLDHGNGEGKSTLLNLMMLRDQPSEGSILINNIDTRHLLKQQVDVFYASQSTEIFNGSVRDNIFLNIHKPDQYLDELIQEYQIQVDIPDLDKEILNGNLSQGEMKTIEIMRLLLTNSSLIVLDELFASLDYQKKLEVLKIIKIKQKDSIIIVVDHEKFIKQFYPNCHVI